MHARIRRSVVAGLAALLLAGALPPVARAHTSAHGEPGREAALRQDMRKLWEDHVTWTRLAIVSLVADLPDAGPTVERLLKNQADIGDAVKPFYGEAAGAQLTGLLREHILGAAAILAAVKGGDTARTDSATAAWYANAEEISAFLSGANPYLPLDEMRSMMRIHLDLTLQEAVDQLQGRYAESVASYDLIHDEILEMSDMLSEGLCRQFPGRSGPDRVGPAATTPVAPSHLKVEGSAGGPGVARLRFAVETPGHVRVRLYDVTGRLVRTLADRSFDTGEHDVTWDGADDGGRAAPRGVYFARLEYAGTGAAIRGRVVILE